MKRRKEDEYEEKHEKGDKEMREEKKDYSY